LRQADGRLWEIDAGVPLSDGAVVVGRRLAGDGRAIAVVHAERPPTGALPHEPRLEEAYSAFLASHGQTLPEAVA